MIVQNSKCKIQNYNSKLKVFFHFALLTVILHFAFYTLHFGVANADDFSLALSPPITEIEITPPDSVKAPITIQNTGDKTVNLQIFLRSFTAADSENGQIKYYPKQRNDPAIFQKVHIFNGSQDIRSISLGPGQKRKLVLSVELDRNDLAGDYYFSIIFASDAATPDQSTSLGEESNLSRVPGGIATNVLLSVGAKGKVSALIQEFSSPWFVQKGPVPFTVRVRNNGERVIAPEGTIIVRNLFNQPIGKIDLLPVNILAGTIRLIPDKKQVETINQLQKNNNSALQNTELKTQNLVKAIWPEEFLIGPYSATVIVNASEKGPSYERTIHFFAFPLQGFVVIGVMIAIVLLVRKRVSKRLK